MSCEINGQHYSYDYEELLQELKSDIKEFNLKPQDLVYILRKEHPLLKNTGYKPIIDYYFADDIKFYETGKLDDIYNRDEFSDAEWTKMENDRLNEIRQYKKDNERLEKATVTAVLTEMEIWNRITQ